MRRCCLWLESPGRSEMLARDWEGVGRQEVSLSDWKLSLAKAWVLSLTTGQVLSYNLMVSGIFDLSLGEFSAASMVQLKQKFASPKKFSFKNISKESPYLQFPSNQFSLCRDYLVGEDKMSVSQLFSFPSQQFFPCYLRFCQNYWHLDHGKLYLAQTERYLRQNIIFYHNNTRYH